MGKYMVLEYLSEPMKTWQDNFKKTKGKRGSGLNTSRFNTSNTSNPTTTESRKTSITKGEHFALNSNEVEEIDGITGEELDDTFPDDDDLPSPSRTSFPKTI